MPKAIYIDVCTLSRPFDEQHFLRIRLETEAFNLILSAVKQHDYTMLISPVHIKEIDAIDDSVERIELQTLLEEYGKPVKVSKTAARKRAEELVKAGFGIADAAHVAFAEQAGAQFVSCDDALVKKCIRHGSKVWCGNPVAFCEKEGLK
jgi:predicted nucleic acid-binding protein